VCARVRLRQRISRVKVAVVLNPHAGDGDLETQDLRTVLGAAGHEVVRLRVGSDWDDSALQGVERVLIAGGDGTVECVIPNLVRRKLPFCVLPSGTANNLAKSLGQTDSLQRLARGLKEFEIHQLDVGKICTGSEERLFVEAAGIGPFVSLMRRLEDPVVRTALDEADSSEERLRQGYQQLQALAANQEPIWCELTVDGESIGGRFVLAEVMNTGLVGPNVALVPNVDPEDGWFDLVLVREEQQHELTRHLANLALGVLAEPTFQRRRCRSVVFTEPPILHVDDDVLDPQGLPTRISMQPGALEYIRTPG
jgi:diacylglycerol kinase (ATP)